MRWDFRKIERIGKIVIVEMKKIYILIDLLVILAVVFSGCIQEQQTITTTESGKKQREVIKSNISVGNTTKNTTIITLYDNYKYNPELKTRWGFSCLVKINDKNILFDTGADSGTLLSNMEKMNIDVNGIDTIVLSHIHGDHVGGLDGILEGNSNLTVYLPKSFPDSFKNKVRSSGVRMIEVKDSIEIYPGIYTTGELGTWIKEQSLVIKTEKGLVVISGCAHPGIVNIVREAKKLTNERVYLVIGGFHLFSAEDSELKRIVKNFRDLEVEKVAPSHCSGDRTRELFEQEYGENFIENGVGRVIEI